MQFRNGQVNIFGGTIYFAGDGTLRNQNYIEINENIANCYKIDEFWKNCSNAAWIFFINIFDNNIFIHKTRISVSVVYTSVIIFVVFCNKWRNYTKITMEDRRGHPLLTLGLWRIFFLLFVICSKVADTARFLFSYLSFYFSTFFFFWWERDSEEKDGKENLRRVCKFSICYSDLFN